MGLFKRTPEKVERELERAQAEYKKAAARFVKVQGLRFPKAKPEQIKAAKEASEAAESRMKILDEELAEMRMRGN